MSGVTTGPGSPEHVRRQLEGSWDIVTYEWYDTGGALLQQQAEGTMRLDEYGNLFVRGKIHGLAGDPDQDVDYTGRIVIDTANESFRLQDIVDRIPVDLPDSFDPALSRFYVLEGDALSLYVRDPAERDTARTVWKKR